MNFRDLIIAARALRKSPVFTFTAALTIALGVGSSTAIFSVTNAVLLRPLFYRDPERLVVASTDMRNRGVRDFPFSNADLSIFAKAPSPPSRILPASSLFLSPCSARTAPRSRPKLRL